MTEAASSIGPQPLPFSQLLTEVLSEHEGDRLSLSELSARLRDRAWGGLLLIFAAVNLLPLPPGTTTITGLPLLVITAQLAFGNGRGFPASSTRAESRGTILPALPPRSRPGSIGSSAS